MNSSMIMSFGRYKGWAVDYVPARYLEWCLRQPGLLLKHREEFRAELLARDEHRRWTVGRGKYA